VSRRGLASVLRDLTGSRWSDKALRNIELEGFRSCAVNERLELDDGTGFNFVYCEPYLMLSWLLERVEYLRDLYSDAVTSSSEGAWHVVIAYDEFTPGSLHSPENRRKSMVLGMNFLEVGPKALSEELTWLLPVILRTDVLHRVRGGFSCVLKVFLRRLLFGPFGLKTAGWALSLRELHVMISGDLWMILADGDGLRQGLDWKGAGGLKPCFRHANVWKAGCDVHGRRDNHVEHSCADHTRFDRLESDELDEFVALLRIAKENRDVAGGGVARLEQIEKSLGFNANLDGVIFDDALREAIDVPSTFYYDWVHACLQDGVVDSAIVAFCRACEEKIGLRMGQIEAYLRRGFDGAFEFPKFHSHKSRQVYRLFNQHHLGGDATKLKGQATEVQSVYTLLRFFFEKEIGERAEVALEWSCFKAACRLVDVVIAAKRGETNLANAATALRRAMADYVVAHTDAFGADTLKPKHHWMFDVADQLERDSRVPDRLWNMVDAYVVERFHVRVKSLFELIDNTTSLETSILGAVLCDQERRLKLHASTLGVSGQLLRRGDMLLGTKLQFGGLSIAAGDVVLRRSTDSCGEVCCCCMDCRSNVLFVIVEVMDYVSQTTTHSSRWSLTGHCAPWPASELSQVAAWYREAGTIVVLEV